MALVTYNHTTNCTDCHCTINYVSLSPTDNRKMVCMECEILLYPAVDYENM